MADKVGFYGLVACGGTAQHARRARVDQGTFAPWASQSALNISTIEADWPEVLTTRGAGPQAMTCHVLLITTSCLS
jgi:hypothetical protein